MFRARPFSEAPASEREQIRRVFASASAGSPGGSLWGDAESEAAVYLDPYLEQEPDSFFLLVDADGIVRGYLAGCLDTARLPSESDRIDAAIREHRLFHRPRTRPFFLRAVGDMALAKLRGQTLAGESTDARWPSHLHIDVVPEVRGTGAADVLMKAWSDRLDASGSPGCHLQTQVENPRARSFFSRHGFVDHGAPAAVPGVRYDGRRVRQQTMVRLTP